MKESVLLVWAGHEFLARGRGPAQMLLCFAVSVDSIGMGNSGQGSGVIPSWLVQSVLCALRPGSVSEPT